jgi:hypothetical protein
MLHNPNCITAILKLHRCLNLPLLFFVLQLYGCKLIFNACCVELKCNEALLLYKSKTLPFIINIACLKKFEIKFELNKAYQKIEGFRELHNNTVPKKHDSQNNTPLNIRPLMHVSDGLYIECPPRGRIASQKKLSPNDRDTIIEIKGSGPGSLTAKHERKYKW